MLWHVKMCLCWILRERVFSVTTSYPLFIEILTSGKWSVCGATWGRLRRTRSATGDFLRFCFSTSTCILAMGLAIARASLASAWSFFCRLRKSMSSRDSQSSSVASLSEYDELCLLWQDTQTHTWWRDVFQEWCLMTAVQMMVSVHGVISLSRDSLAASEIPHGQKSL